MNEELKVISSAEISDLKKGVSDAKAEVEKFSKGTKTSFKDVSDAFQKVGNVAKTGLKVAAGAIAGATTALLALTASTEEYRTAQAKLTTAFETAGGSAETAKNTYNDLYRVLGDGDVAVEAANHLAQLTTNEKELSEWTTICQGVYATFGDSLPIEGLTEAANETAKVGTLTGSLADALNWAGVNEEEFQAKLDACTSAQEREALIRETLTGLYDDAAAGYEKNAAALLAQNEANARMAESTAKIGEALAPVNTALTNLGATILSQLTPYIEDFAANHLPNVIKALSGVGDAVGKVMSFIADNWEIISTIGAIIAAVAVTISVLSTALGVYNTVMAITTAVSAPVIGIVAAIVVGITALIAIIVLCVKHWDEIKAAIGDFCAKASEWFNNLWENLKAWFTGIIEGFSNWWNTITTGFSNFFSNIWEGISQWWSNLTEGFAEWWTGIGDGLSEWWGNVKEGWSEFWSGVGDLVSAGKENVVNWFNNMKDGATEKAQEMWSNVKEKFNSIKETMSTVMQAAKDTVQEKLNNMKQAYQENGGGLKGIAAATMEGIKGYWTAGFTFIDNLTGGKLTTIYNTINSKLTAAKSTVSNILESIKSKFNSIMESAKTIVSNAIEKIKSFFKFEWSLPKIKLPHFSISGSFSLNPPSVPHFSISWYEKGGVFDNPTLFSYGHGMLGGLGENGAEAVVPLEKNTYWLDKIADRLAERQNTQPIVLQVDGKTFAQISVDSINALTRQRGSLALNLV